MRHAANPRIFFLSMLFVPLVTASHAGASSETPDPYERFNAVVEGMKNGNGGAANDSHPQPEGEVILPSEAIPCENRLLPVPLENSTLLAAGRIKRAIESLGVGQALLIDDPDMGSGHEAQWRNLLHGIGLRVLGMRPVDAFLRTRVLVQKAEPAQGVQTRIVNAFALDSPPKFNLVYFKNRRTRRVHEMLDVAPGVFAFPWYLENAKVRVLLRPQGPGLPILEQLEEVGGTNYLPQPIHMLLANGENPGRKVVNLLKTLSPESVPSFFVKRTEHTHFTSPGTLLSPLRSVSLRLEVKPASPIFDWVSWDAATLLVRLEETAAADGILELNLHLLLDEAGVRPPPWAGERLYFENLDAPVGRNVPPLEFPRYRTWRRKRWFLPQESADWRFVSSDIQEVNAQGGQVKVGHAEYAVSRLGSSNLVSLLPVKKINGRIWVGLLQSDSPAPQVLGETSTLWTMPIWRVFRGETRLAQAVRDAKGQFEQTYDLKVKTLQSLGASFRADPDVSADLIFPYVAEVESSGRSDRMFTWYPLDFLESRLASLRDTRLMLALFRLRQAR